MEGGARREMKGVHSLFLPSVFLSNLIRNLRQKYDLGVQRDASKTCNYASVAIIIRIKPDRTDHIFNSPLFKASVAAPDADSLESLLDFVSSTWVRAGTLELLYIKRTARKQDKFSGQVAFPGGKQEDAESAQVAAMREVAEEVGLDISDTKKFVCLGQLQARHFRTDKELLVSSFVFLQVAPVDLPLQLQHSEVADARWIPVHPTFSNFRLIEHCLPARDTQIFYGKLGQLFVNMGVKSIVYPRLLLPVYSPRCLPLADTPHSTTMTTPPPDDTEQWELWGLSLSLSLELVLLAGHNDLHRILTRYMKEKWEGTQSSAPEQDGEETYCCYDEDNSRFTKEHYATSFWMQLRTLHVPHFRSPYRLVDRLASCLWVINDRNGNNSSTLPLSASPAWRGATYLAASAVGIPLLYYLIGWLLWRNARLGGRGGSGMPRGSNNRLGFSSSAL